MQTFGGEVRALREALGFSQRELAERAGITQGAVGHFESNRRVPGADVLFSLAAALNVSCDHFKPFFGQPDTPPPAKPGRAKKPTTEPEPPPKRKKPRGG